MRISIRILLLCILFLGQRCAAQEVGSLDITTVIPKERIHQPEGEGGGSCGSAEHVYYPEVLVRLISLDNTHYGLGESVTFEVKIQNVGKEPIILPWSPELANLEPQEQFASYSYRQGTISLDFRVRDRQFSIFSHLYGSPAVLGSMKEVLPGQWVMVRASPKLVIYDDWISNEFAYSDMLTSQVNAGLMLNEVEFLLRGKDGKPAERSSCIMLRTQRANQLQAMIFRTAGK